MRRMMEPVFGKTVFRSNNASRDNPRRDGIYVRTRIRKGPFNPGKHYVLTDGKGNFWEYSARNVVVVEEGE